MSVKVVKIQHLEKDFLWSCPNSSSWYFVSKGFHFFLFALIKIPLKESICIEAQGSPHFDKLLFVLHLSDFDRVSKETGDSFYIK